MITKTTERQPVRSITHSLLERIAGRNLDPFDVVFELGVDERGEMVDRQVKINLVTGERTILQTTRVMQ